MEVNLLTGETTILRTDIIYDCGQSLNPAVDLGQVNRIQSSALLLTLKLFLSQSLSMSGIA